MKRFLSSFFLRVAVGLVLAFIAGLWFVAIKITPDAVYVTASGATRHVFWQVAFLGRMFVAYLMILPVVYGVARVVRWLTGPP